MPENILLTLLCAPGTKKFLKILVYLRTNSLTFCVFLVHENNYWTPWLLTWPLATIKIQRKLLRLFETFHLLKFYSALLVTGWNWNSLWASLICGFWQRNVSSWKVLWQDSTHHGALTFRGIHDCGLYNVHCKFDFAGLHWSSIPRWPVFHNVTS